MQIRVNGRTLEGLLKRAILVIRASQRDGSNGLVPLLSSVHIEAITGPVIDQERAPGLVIVKATNLDIGLVQKIEADVVEPGTVTVNAQRLYNVIDKMPREPIHIRNGEKKFSLLVEAGGGRASIVLEGHDPSDFPRNLPEENEEDVEVRVPGKMLSEMIRATRKTISRDETRQNLSGIYLDVEKTENSLCAQGLLRMSSSDGFRLSIIERRTTHVIGDFPQTQIPSAGIPLLYQALQVARNGVTLRRTPVWFALDVNTGVENIAVLMKVDENMQFPNISEVLKTKPVLRATLTQSDIVESLARLKDISTPQGRGIKMLFNCKANQVEFYINTPDIGRAKVCVPLLSVACTADKTPSFGCNLTLLDEIIRIAEPTDEVTFLVQDDLAPVDIRFAQDPDYRALLMPAKLS